MALALAAGAAAATAVIVGALLVGDSARMSLRGLVIDRLGAIDHAILANRFFRQSSLQGLDPNLDHQVHPAIQFVRASAESSTPTGKHRAGNLTMLAVDDAFWDVGDQANVAHPHGREVVINQNLADDLKVSVGDEITLRVPTAEAVPGDSPLGKKEGQVERFPGLRVIAILSNRGLGRFDWRPSQKPPRVVFVDRKFVAEQLKVEGKINAILFSRRAGQADRSGDLPLAQQEVDGYLKQLDLSLEDLGLRMQRVTRKFPDSTEPTESKEDAAIIFDYFHLTGEQLLLPDAVVQQVESAFPPERLRKVLVYLANGIQKIAPTPADPVTAQQAIGREVPYSIVAAIDSSADFPLPYPASDAASKEGAVPVVINQWLADQLQAKAGDRLRLAYYLPENAHGQEVERQWDVQVCGVVPLTTPQRPYRRRQVAQFDRPPTVYNDPSIPPEVPGITDQESIEDWDLPFALQRPIAKEDDAYWNDHRLTPKLFLPYGEGVERFGSRFGSATSIRILPSAGEDLAAMESRLLGVVRQEAKSLGLQPLALRATQLDAARGTTPFDGLFLALSFFVILAALLLVSLLFRLSLEQRASQWGTMLAMGWPGAAVRWLQVAEAGWVSLLGVLAGLPLGYLYARGVVHALQRWWVGAIQVPFLEFHGRPASYLLGAISALAAVMATVLWAARGWSRMPARELLQGNLSSKVQRGAARSPMLRWLIGGLAVLAGLAWMAGWWLSGQAAAGAFVGAGMAAVLWAVLQLYRSWTLPSIDSRPASAMQTFQNLLAKNVHRNPMRSALASGLIATASFLLMAISLFHSQADPRGVGGWQWIAESSQPILRDLNDPKVQQQVLGPRRSQLDGVTIVSARMRAGDDASCGNLYQSQQPRVLGMRPEIVDWELQLPSASRFPWAGYDKSGQAASLPSPWRLLERPGDGTIESPLPVILDQNTAMWSLHRGAKIGEVFSFEMEGRPVFFKTVGLLQNTLLQGSLIIGEENFRKAFPSLSGYQWFLVGGKPPSDLELARQTLEEGWSEEGWTAQSTYGVLDQLLAVQNTYLKAFQALGALGLLLGTLGLAVVQVRSVLERRSELALLRSLGYSPQRVGKMLSGENLRLLAIGLGIGVGSAALAALPAWWRGQSIGSMWGPISMLGIVLVCGIAAGALAVRQANRLPILDALRGK